MKLYIVVSTPKNTPWPNTEGYPPSVDIYQKRYSSVMRRDMLLRNNYDSYIVVQELDLTKPAHDSPRFFKPEEPKKNKPEYYLVTLRENDGKLIAVKAYKRLHDAKNGATGNSKFSSRYFYWAKHYGKPITAEITEVSK